MAARGTTIVPDGMTIHGPGRKYKGGEEIPNDLLPTAKTAAFAGDPTVATDASRKSVKPANEPA